MSEVNFEIPEQLIVHAKDGGIVVMVGAGVSAEPPSSLPSWKELNFLIVSALCHRIDTYLDRPGYTNPLREVIDARRNANLFPPDYQSQILEENSGEHYFRALQSLDLEVFNSAHEGIIWLAKHGIVSAIVTTNFDRLLERACDAYNVQYEVAYEPKTYERALQSLQQDSPDTPLQILKIHGCVQDLHSLIDTLKQRLLGRNVYLERSLSYLLEKYLCLYVGFSAADLESDSNYLQLLSSAARSPGLVYVQWPGSKNLNEGAKILLNAYKSKASKVVAELNPFFRSLRHLLALPEPPSMPADAKIKQPIEEALNHWAMQLHPAAAVNCLVGMAEANGETEAAFQLLHRFWKDVIPKDRSGKDFEFFRFQHGRLGMGGGILSLIDSLDSTEDSNMLDDFQRIALKVNTAEYESIQNLLRRGAKGDARALAWAGMAYLWSGFIELAQSYLFKAAEYLDQGSLSPEERIDVYLALAEAFYVFGQPKNLEVIIGTWKNFAQTAVEIGDLPRQANIIVITSLYFADFLPTLYKQFIKENAETVLERVNRLNNPLIAGFAYLAEGRFFTKQRDGVAAIEALSRALNYLKEAGRPPWRIFAAIEYAKALLDQKKVEESADVLNDVNKFVDSYQVWLIWLEEAKGQLYLSLSQNDEARQAFNLAIDYATKLGLKNRADILRKYLNHLE
ncbi:MAG: SIR2 family protein [Promethearchaeota archaeon]